MIDRGNTTRHHLGADEEFPGTVTRVGDLVRVFVLIATDTAGTLFIEHSLDGESWPVSQEFMVKANTPLFEETRLGGRFYRIRLVNDAAPQTVLFLASSTFYTPSTPRTVLP